MSQGLDEVQSYILLRRWAAGAAGAAGGSLPPTGLSGTQLAELGEAYCRERLCLLKATEGLLWLGEGALHFLCVFLGCVVAE